MDIPGCVFVLAVDYEVVQMGMAEKLGVDLQKTSGKSFFDKIIQLPFEMPNSSYDIDQYLMHLITKINYTQFKSEGQFREKQSGLIDGDIGFFRNITVCTVGRNPRSIKRVMNYAKLLDDIRTKFLKSPGLGDQGRDFGRYLAAGHELAHGQLVKLQELWMVRTSTIRTSCNSNSFFSQLQAAQGELPQDRCGGRQSGVYNFTEQKSTETVQCSTEW